MQLEKMEKTVIEAVEKLEKLKVEGSLGAELSWCWFSFKNDHNPEGLVQKGQETLAVFQAAREKSARAVSKKLVEDLEKVIALN